MKVFFPVKVKMQTFVTDPETWTDVTWTLDTLPQATFLKSLRQNGVHWC